MNAWRYSLARLLRTIGVISIACAALARATPFWAMTVSSAAVGVLLYAILGAVYRSGAKRAFWVGVTTFGWGYFLLVSVSYWVSSEDLPLITTCLLELVNETRPAPVVETEAAWVSAPAPTANASAQYGVEFQLYTAANPPPANVAPGTLTPATIALGNDDAENFHLIGQCLWTLALGCVGGVVARRLYTAESAMAGIAKVADEEFD